MPPICISVINMKGGVGKTTIAALLSRYAAGTLGCQTLAIDLDPQANLSQALMGGEAYRRFLDDKAPSIVEVFAGYQPPAHGSGSASPLSVSDVVWKVHPHSKLRVLPSRFDFSDNLRNATTPDPRRLAQLIANDFQDEALVIIDCAPTESVFTMAAYHASRYILVPVRPEFFATIGFPLLQDSLDAFRDSNRGHQIDVIGVVVNNANYDGGNNGGPEKATAMKEIREEANLHGWHIFNNEIGYSRGFPKMMRGDYSYIGNAASISKRFAEKFFSAPELSAL